MHQVIVGTAGHVDHGKTRLVKALTGIETDRLIEEQKRGISIELGFAPLAISENQKIGLVDVPGHEKFIKQMLAGVAGIDLVLLVIAADEGVKPQTQEHLDIIHLLQVKQGIVVITKKDLVDEEWLEILQLEIQDILKGTVLQDAPMIAVSSQTGEGIEALKKLIAKVAAQTIPKSATGKTRLPIDRVFSITGFGTVVTGTLWSGTIRLGDNVEILPQGIQTRIRSLQVHGEKKESAQAGQRVAVNITGVEVEDIERGSVLAAPGYLNQTYRFNAKILLLEKAEKELNNLDRIRIYHGTKEVLGKVRLLDRDALEQGHEAFVQIYLDKPLVAAKGDRFVIRTYSPMHTIAGGTIIDPLTPKHKRFQAGLIEKLQLQEKGDPDQIILEYLYQKEKNIVVPKAAARDMNMPENEAEAIIDKLVAQGEAIILGKNIQEGVIAKITLQSWLTETLATIENYHAAHPLRWGISKEELRSRLFSHTDAKIYNFILEMWEKENKVQLHGQYVSLYGRQPLLSEKHKQITQGIISKIKAGGLQPPSPLAISDEYKLQVKERTEILNYMLDSGILIKLDEEIFFHKEILSEAMQKLIAFTKENKSITLGEARDVLGSSRKYVLPILEYMDEKRITRRVGDKRVVLSGQ